MTNMDPNQRRLKRARADIEAVLKKHDVAGFITLHAPGWNEVFWNIWPTHSALIGDFPAIRVKSKLADYGGNALKQQAHQANTAQAVHTIATSMGGYAMQFLQLAEVLNAKLGATHQDGGFQPAPSSSNPDLH